MAQEILRSPTALSYARQNKWAEAVQSMPEVCKAFGSTLIAEHDRLYGPGTGKAFVEGPYASDLPRALKARIRPALKRQAAQLATFEDGPEPLQRPLIRPASPAVPAAGAKQPVEKDVLRLGYRYRRGPPSPWRSKARLQPRSPFHRSSLRPGT